MIKMIINRILIFLIIVSIFVTSVFAAPPSISTGDETWGSQWYSGSGVPASSLGSINDFYLNSDNGYVYKKDATGWVYIMSMSLPDTDQFYFLNGTRHLTGIMDAGGYNITNLSTPVGASDAATKGYVDTQIAGVPTYDVSQYYFLNGTRILTGIMDAGGFNLSNLSDPNAAQDAATRNYVDVQIAAIPGSDTSGFYFLNGTRILTGVLNAGGFNLSNVSDPNEAQDAATRNYVDTEIASIPVTDTTVFYFLNGTRMLEGNMNAGLYIITNLTDPINASDSANKGYVDLVNSTMKNYVDAEIAGISSPDLTPYLFINGTRDMTGSLNSGGFNISNVGDPTEDHDAVTLSYLNTSIAAIPTQDLSAYYLLNGSRPLTGDMEVNGYYLHNVSMPTDNFDGVPKFYVDEEIGEIVFNRDGVFSNAIINSNFDVWQRGTTFDSTTSPANSDDTYLVDRFVLLSDGNDIVDVSQSTDTPDGSKYSLKSLVATANKKFGYLYILESIDSLKFDDQQVSLSFQAKTTSGKEIENLRAGILSWSSTADTVTSDVVSAWNAEGSDPTLAANWNYENTPANIAITTSYAKYEVENVTVDTASMANLAVFIWVDDGDAAVNDELYLSQIQLNVGATAYDYTPYLMADELGRCKRYYEKWSGAAFTPVAGGWNEATTYSYDPWAYTVEKRTAPTITTNNVTWWQVRPAGVAGVATTNLEFTNIGTKTTLIKATVAGGLTAGAVSFLRSAAASAVINVNAEL